MVWYSHLLKNFPQFVMIYTVKGFGIGNKAETDVFLELSCFLDNPADVGNLISGSSAFSKISLHIWNYYYTFYYTFKKNSVLFVNSEDLDERLLNLNLSLSLLFSL